MAKHRLFDAKRSGGWFVRVGPRGHYLSWHGAMAVVSSYSPLNGPVAHFYPVS